MGIMVRFGGCPRRPVGKSNGYEATTIHTIVFLREIHLDIPIVAVS
jgi:hypothetical protein